MPCCSLRQFDATKASILELPIGSSMYLRSTALMSAIFFATGIVSLFSALEYSQESRWGPDRLSDSLSRFATRMSVADFTPANYTADGFTADACSQHGFAASTCQKWRNDGDSGDSLFNWVCGKASGNVTGQTSVNYRSLHLTIESCAVPAIQCLCFPGYSGAACEIPQPSVIKPNSGHPVVAARHIDGWCRPSVAAVSALISGTLITNTRVENSNNNNASLWSCSGRGACVLRAPSGGRSYNYSFCYCDVGAWGSYCENTNPNDYIAGASNLALHSSNTKEGCQEGIVPRFIRGVGSISIHPEECAGHGTPMKLATDTFGKYINQSSFFRPQSEGVCACEPGYTGEQCLGGRQVTDHETIAIISAISSIFLLLGSLCLYRERKRAGYVYDATHITPSDFSIFVDGLPELSAEDVPSLEVFFSKWGPIHSVAPAFNDEMLRWWQTRTNDCLRWELISNQLKKGNKTSTGTTATSSSLPLKHADSSSSNAIQESVAYRDWEKRLGTIPALLPGEVAWGRTLMRFMSVPGIFENVTIGSDSFRRKFIAGCQLLIKEELNNPETRLFERCVITYEKTESFEHALVDFHKKIKDSSMVHCFKIGSRSSSVVQPDDELFFRGHALDVSLAPEPNEVLWDSLDTSPRERSVRKWISLLFLVCFCVAIFVVLKKLPTGDPGIIGVLVSIFIVLLNRFVAEIWFYVAKYGEQDETEGAQTRSIFFKTLATQLTIMFAATVGVSGIPFNLSNGYIIDFFQGTAGFMMRTTIAEAVIPPLLSVFAVGWRFNLFYFGKTQSKDYLDLLQEPPNFVLAERCAAFMRIVLMSCTFSCGMPLLNLLTAVVILNMVIADTYALTRIYAMEPAGPELARALELLLIVGAMINAIISWLTLRNGNSDSLIIRSVLFFVILFIVWIAASYFTYKQYRKRGCFCGMGFLWLGPLFCFSPWFIQPFDNLNSFFIKIVLGESFYTSHNDAVDDIRSLLKLHENSSSVERILSRVVKPLRMFGLSGKNSASDLQTDEDSHDETGGRTYTEIAECTPTWELRAHPYCIWERAQLRIWKTPQTVQPLSPPITAAHVAFLRTAILEGDHHLPEWLRFEIESSVRSLLTPSASEKEGGATMKNRSVQARDFGLKDSTRNEDMRMGVNHGGGGGGGGGGDTPKVSSRHGGSSLEGSSSVEERN